MAGVKKTMKAKMATVQSPRSTSAGSADDWLFTCGLARDAAAVAVGLRVLFASGTDASRLLYPAPFEPAALTPLLTEGPEIPGPPGLLLLMRFFLAMEYMNRLCGSR